MSETVLITGSSRGIGKACALAFAEKGYNVVLNCIKNEDKMNAVIGRIKKTNPNVMGFVCDVSDHNAVKIMVNEINKSFGGIDILVNNAGISHTGLFQDMTPKEWKRLTEVNLYGIFNTTHLVVPYMLSKKKGSIINISSVWGVSGGSCEAVYSATKGAVNAFTRAMAKELGPSGIRVNALYLGCIDTEMNNNLSHEEKTALAEDIPLMRFGAPEEAAEAVLFLASDKASYINGQILGVDGGFL